MSKQIPFGSPTLQGFECGSGKARPMRAGVCLEKGWCPACGRLFPTKHGAVVHLGMVHALTVANRDR